MINWSCNSLKSLYGPYFASERALEKAGRCYGFSYDPDGFDWFRLAFVYLSVERRSKMSDERLLNRFAFRLSDGDKNKVADLVKSDGTCISDLIRRLINDEYDRKISKNGKVGSGCGGNPVGSVGSVGSVGCSGFEGFCGS